MGSRAGHRHQGHLGTHPSPPANCWGGVGATVLPLMLLGASALPPWPGLLPLVGRPEAPAEAPQAAATPAAHPPRAVGASLVARPQVGAGCLPRALAQLPLGLDGGSTPPREDGGGKCHTCGRWSVKPEAGSPTPDPRALRGGQHWADHAEQEPPPPAR